MSKAVSRKRITLTPEGLIDPVAADAQWARNTRVRAGSGQAAGAAGSPAALTPALASALAGVVGLEASARSRDLDDGVVKPGGDNYSKNRGRREAAEAETSEIELAKLKCSVIEVAAVEKLWAQRMSQTREVLQQLRSRLAPRLAAETDVRKIDDMLTSEHDSALRAMAGQSAPDVQEAAA